jgi:hypothetical protein
MRTILASALIAGLALAVGAQSAEAGRSYRQPRSSDCVPTNGPFGFYGNLWCKPTEEQYLRTLSAQWPMETPRSLRNPKPSSNYTW